MLAINLQLADYLAETPPRSEEIKERLEVPIWWLEGEVAPAPIRRGEKSASSVHAAAAGDRCGAPVGSSTACRQACTDLLGPQWLRPYLASSVIGWFHRGHGRLEIAFVALRSPAVIFRKLCTQHRLIAGNAFLTSKYCFILRKWHRHRK